MHREILLKRVVLKCRDFVRQLSYHRAMLPHSKNLRTNIWIYTFNNFIDMAVLDWCHLFGSQSDDLHWRRIVVDAEWFKSEILKSLGLTGEEWDAYWKSIKDYRDKDVAHIEVRPETSVPKMDKALEAIKLYYSYAIDELHDIYEYIELPDVIDHFIDEVSRVADNYVNKNIVHLFEYAEPT